MKGKLPALALLFLLCAGFADPEVFRKDGITFAVPKGWTITEEESWPDGAGYFLTCEKSGSGSSGIFTIFWTNTERNPEEAISGYATALKENYTQQKAAPQIQPSRPAAYAGMTGVRRDYTVRQDGKTFRGTIYALRGCGKTITLVRQEAVEHMADNKAGFDRIAATLRCASGS